MDELIRQGWNISQDGHNLITANGTIKDYKSIYGNALNTDIKDFGEPALSSAIKKTKIEKVVLQIQKVRNVAAPKAKEESQFAPRMLKLTLTDGHTNCQAIEIANISSLSRINTPPGTKIQILDAKVASGCILLSPNNCKVLGGQVPALCEKWEVVKNMSNHVRTLGGTDGAPPWVNFGEKIVGFNPNEPFKSLVTKPTSSENPDEFVLQRQGAIAVASSGAVKKVFGGGTKVLENQPPPTRKPQQQQHNNYRNKREPREKFVVEKSQKPAEKVSLFDFLGDKLDNKPIKSAEPVKFQGGNFGKINKDPVESLVNNFNRVTVNSHSQYGSRNVKQSEPGSGGWKWQVGDLCMAKYWEDGKYYNAQVRNLTDSTCVVQFNGYGNVEEVLKLDCIPISNEEEQDSQPRPNKFNNEQYKGSAGYRSNKRQYNNSYRTFNNKAS